MFKQWLPHLPAQEEIEKLALQIWHEENPHLDTNPEAYELKLPEGKYYQKARGRIMAGYVAMIEVALKAYREELFEIIEYLKTIETPVWGTNIKALSEAIEKLEEAVQ